MVSVNTDFKYLFILYVINIKILNFRYKSTFSPSSALILYIYIRIYIHLLYLYYILYLISYITLLYISKNELDQFFKDLNKENSHL